MRRKPYYLIYLLLFLLPGCLGENRDPNRCDRELSISFYSRTRCQTVPTYPTAIGELTYGVFDSDGILVAHGHKRDIPFDAEYTETVTVETGLYTVIAWSGLDGPDLHIAEWTDGTTRREDLLFEIRRSGTQAASIEGNRIYMGESPAVYTGDQNSGGPTSTTSVNLLEVTNRVTVSVEGLPEDGVYEIVVEANNGSMNNDGTIAADETLKFTPLVTSTIGTLESEFTLLKLDTGYEYTIVVRQTADHTELYRGSLLGALILKNPSVDLHCDHDFTIRFTAEDQCECGTYAIVEIYVNNWLVHSYGTDF